MVILQSNSTADAAKNLVELLLSNSSYPDLCLQAPQKGFIGQFFWMDVSCKNDNKLERNLDFLATRQREEIGSTVEGHDPTVEKFVWAQALPTEIIDDEDAAVRLHPNRASIEPGDRVELQIQHVNSQLTTDLNRRTLA